jgi:hypothetical protein
MVDRRLLLATLQSDPLYLVLTGMLSIGTIMALLTGTRRNLIYLVVKCPFTPDHLRHLASAWRHIPASRRYLRMGASHRLYNRPATGRCFWSTANHIGNPRTDVHRSQHNTGQYPVLRPTNRPRNTNCSTILARFPTPDRRRHLPDRLTMMTRTVARPVVGQALRLDAD